MILTDTILKRYTMVVKRCRGGGGGLALGAGSVGVEGGGGGSPWVQRVIDMETISYSGP